MWCVPFTAKVRKLAQAGFRFAGDRFERECEFETVVFMFWHCTAIASVMDLHGPIQMARLRLGGE